MNPLLSIAVKWYEYVQERSIRSITEKNHLSKPLIAYNSPNSFFDTCRSELMKCQRAESRELTIEFGRIILSQARGRLENQEDGKHHHRKANILSERHASLPIWYGTLIVGEPFVSRSTIAVLNETCRRAIEFTAFGKRLCKDCTMIVLHIFSNILNESISVSSMI